MTTAPAPDPEPCQNCGQVHEPLDLSKMDAEALHAYATAALVQEAISVVEGAPGTYPRLERALEAIGATAEYLLLEKASAQLSARKSQAPEQVDGQLPLPFPARGVGPYL